VLIVWLGRGRTPPTLCAKGSAVALIYLADDEREVREILNRFLAADGHEVLAFGSGSEFWDVFSRTPCDLAILDIMMPGIDGIELLARIRGSSQVPVVMVSAKDSDEDYCRGLVFGADDYITKPFKPTLLVAKVRSILHRIDVRSRDLGGMPKRWGNLEYCARTRTFSVDGMELALTAQEHQLLLFYFKKFNVPVSRDELSREVWGSEPLPASRAIDEANRRLRRRLLAAGSTVYNQTVWGLGYRLTYREGEGRL